MGISFAQSPPRAELNERQRRFLMAALAGAADDGTFCLEATAQRLQLPMDEASDTATAVASGNQMLGAINVGAEPNGNGGEDPLAHVTGTYFRLTAVGRDTGRQLLEDARARRKARLWTVAKYLWVTAMTVSLPLTTNCLNRKIERLENAASKADGR
jgi:hypothetical protein